MGSGMVRVGWPTAEATAPGVWDTPGMLLLQQIKEEVWCGGGAGVALGLMTSLQAELSCTVGL